MLHLLVILNVLSAAGILLGLWLSEAYRRSGLGHLTTLAAIGGLCWLALAVSWRAETPESMHFTFIVVAGVLFVLYVPFLMFLAYVYLHAFVSVLDGTGASGLSRPNIKAEHYLAVHNYRHAVRALRKVLAANPNDVEARLKLADTLVEMGALEDAVAAYRVAVTQLSHDPKRQIEVIFRSAEVLAEMLGEYKLATRELDVIRKRYPDTPEARLAQRRIAEYLAEE